VVSILVFIYFDPLDFIEYALLFLIVTYFNLRSQKPIYYKRKSPNQAQYMPKRCLKGNSYNDIEDTQICENQKLRITWCHKQYKLMNYPTKNEYKIWLNMFLVPIKLRPSKFSPYLILIAFLIPTKKIYYNFSPC